VPRYWNRVSRGDLMRGVTAEDTPHFSLRTEIVGLTLEFQDRPIIGVVVTKSPTGKDLEEDPPKKLIWLVLVAVLPIREVTMTRGLRALEGEVSG